MDPKEVKQALKTIREHIAEKKHSDALKLCQVIRVQCAYLTFLFSGTCIKWRCRLHVIRVYGRVLCTRGTVNGSIERIHKSD
jgi:hypothetical protein